MAITIMPRDYNPWVQALPSFLQNMALQKMGQRFRGQMIEQERELQKKQRAEDRKYEVEKGTAQLQQAGYVESEAHVPDVEFGGKGFMQPKQIVDFKEVNGQIVPVYSQQRYGKDPEFQKTGTAVKTGTPKFVNSKQGILKWNEKTKQLEPTGYDPFSSKGTKLTFEDGKLSFTQGDVGELTKTNKTAVQKEAIDINARMQRLSNVITSYKGSYQNVFTKIGKSWDSLKDMTGLGKPLTPNQKKSLAEYTMFRKNAVREFALEIQKLGKGNLTKNEEKLYGLGLPKPGKGWFDGDSPVEFEAALKNTYKNLDKVRARTHYYLNRLRYSPEQLESRLARNDVLSVDAFVEMADAEGRKKAAQIEAQMKASGQPIDAQSIKRAVAQFLKTEFGFSF